MVFTDDTTVAFLDARPVFKGHVLVVPREHAVLMGQVSDAGAMRTFMIARYLGEIARHTLGASGVNLLVADGEVAFQDVPHFHVHVIPRYQNDGFSITFPHGYEQPPARAALDTIGAAIRAGTGR